MEPTPTSQTTTSSSSSSAAAPPPTSKQEIEQLVEKLRDGSSTLVIKDRFSFLTKYKNCFIGKELIDALLKLNSNFQRSDAAAFVADVLVAKYNLIYTADKQQLNFKDDGNWYCFRWDDQDKVLNTKKLIVGENGAKTTTAPEVAEAMRKTLLNVFGKFLAEDGSAVDYEGLKSSKEFKEEYLPAAQELQVVQMESLSVEERKAFFLNVYNALCLHGVIEFGNPGSSISRLQFYSKVSYAIGGLTYSLNDIEHGILRSNRSAPGLGALKGPLFTAKDPRFAFIIPQCDPRIHFCLNCAANSCPPIRFYSAKKLKKELNMAASSFCNAEVTIDTTKKEIRLSKIFSWYYNDFATGNLELLQFIVKHLKEPKKGALQMVVDNFTTTPFRIVYNSYDWNLNSKK